MKARGLNLRELDMVARVEAYQAAVTLLHDLPPYEQCRSIVQMVYDGSLTQEQGLQLLYLLVDHEIDASDRMARPRAIGRLLVDVVIGDHRH